MSERHAKGATRPLQAQTAQSPGILMVANCSNGNGEIPQFGRFTASRWAEMLQCDRRTVEKYVKKYKTPYRQPGNQMIIDAVELWASWPVEVWTGGDPGQD